MEEQKIKANVVGATMGGPYFEEKAKEQNGITLIALIITIIVMLILVGVTVATVSDGGLFQKAKTATEQTEEKAIYEQLVGVMKLGRDRKINVEDTFGAAKTMLGEKVKLKSPSTENEITDNATIEVTGKNGKTYTYTITTEKIITGELNSYGYGYWSEEFKEYVYFLDNGILILEVQTNEAVDGHAFLPFEYSLSGNIIYVPVLDTQAVLSDDCKTITMSGNVYVRDDSKIFKSEGTLNTEYNIYSNAIYCSSDAKCFLNTDEVHEYGFIIQDTDTNQYSFAEFVAMDGVEISEDGKQIVYDGIIYYLLEV